MSWQLSAMVLALAVLISIGVVLSAVVMRFACRHLGLAQPPFRRALWVCFLAALACVGLSLTVGLASGRVGIDGKLPGGAELLSAGLLASLAIGVMLAVLIYAKMVPASIGKALLIWLAQAVAVLLPGAAIVVLLYFLVCALSGPAWA